MASISESDDTVDWVEGNLPAEEPAAPAPPAREEAPDGEKDEGAVAAEKAAVEEAAPEAVVAEEAATETAGAEEPKPPAATSPAASEAEPQTVEPPIAAEAAEKPAAEVTPEATPEPVEPPAAPETPLAEPKMEPASPELGEEADSSAMLRPIEPGPVAAEELPLPPILPTEPLSLESLVESLLFVAEGPVPVARLVEALEVAPREVEAALTKLTEAYQHRGLSLQRSHDKVQLTTAPAAADRVQRFLGLAAATPLSRAALETLAIIAYQQPVTRPQIEAVRGVNSDGVIKNLLSKGIIEEVGRTDGPGRPVLYATTPEFLQYFGITSLADLPPLNLEQKPAQSPLDATSEILKE